MVATYASRLGITSDHLSGDAADWSCEKPAFCQLLSSSSDAEAGNLFKQYMYEAVFTNPLCDVFISCSTDSKLNPAQEAKNKSLHDILVFLVP